MSGGQTPKEPERLACWVKTADETKAGIDLAKVALALNPACSSDLWNTLGDGLFEYGRYAEARSAYHKALEVNDADVRARYNLA
jgi:Flp pilus assembly protein TadD